MESGLQLLAVAALVAANAFFVVTEFSITRMRPTRVDELERERRRGAGSVRHAVEHIDAYLAACQLGITIASIGLGAVGKPAFERLLEPALGEGSRIGGIALAGLVAFTLITVLHVVVGELSPKSLAIARTDRSALAVATPMRVFYVATKPAVDLFNGMGNLLLKPFGIPPAREVGHAPHTEDELRSLIRESEEEGLLAPEEQEFADRAFTFADRSVEEVMVPRDEVSDLGPDSTVREATERALADGHTRLPVLDSANRRPDGYVHALDLLDPGLGGGQAVDGIARPLARVADDTGLDEALRVLRRRREELAAVMRRDEWLGIVSVEDLLEHIVGDLEDEFD